MRRFRRLRQIGQLLRFIEAAAALLLLSYSSTHIPTAATISIQFLRRAAAFLISPHFVFLLGNAIVLVLVKSGLGRFSSQSAAAGIGNIRVEMSCSPPQAFGEEVKTACGEKVERRGEAAHDGGEVAREDGLGAEEEGDDEEFRRMIEEFIEKQQRFRREESLAVVASLDGVEDPN